MWLFTAAKVPLLLSGASTFGAFCDFSLFWARLPVFRLRSAELQGRGGKKQRRPNRQPGGAFLCQSFLPLSEPHYHTIIIGAGQAGLAAAYYLQQGGHDCLLLDANDRVGDSWRQRWEGLRLFSPQKYNALPGLLPPGDDLHLPSRLEIADYLEDYAHHFAFNVSSSSTCVRAQKEADDRWAITTDKGATHHARHLVVATGAYHTPWKPAAIADSFPADISQYHSSEIRDVAAIAGPDTDALVVGAGASGQQLSGRLLDAGASVTLAGPDVPNLPRNFLGQDIYWWLYNSGLMTLRTDRFPGKLMVQQGAGDVTVAEPPLPAAIRRIKTEIARYADGQLRCNGEKKGPDPIPWPAAGKRGLLVWCTGYRNKYPFLPTEMLVEDGSPLMTDAHSSVYPEVSFIGLPNLRRPNSSLIGGVGRDAALLNPTD